MILKVWELIGYVVGLPKTKVLGFPPPLEWEKEMSMYGMTHFFRNDNQIQWEQRVRCGYYCLLFLTERNKGTSFADILKMFSNDLLQNEEIVKKYFS